MVRHFYTLQSNSFFNSLLLIREREKEKETSTCCPLCMLSVTHSCMCPDTGGNPNLGVWGDTPTNWATGRWKLVFTPSSQGRVPKLPCHLYVCLLYFFCFMEARLTGIDMLLFFIYGNFILIIFSIWFLFLILIIETQMTIQTFFFQPNLVTCQILMVTLKINMFENVLIFGFLCN